MKIGVCLKQVPASDAPLEIDWDHAWVRETDTTFVTNEPDTYALEEALRQKDSGSTEVVVIAVGPDRLMSTLREALAKGADRAILIRDEQAYFRDPLETAASIAVVASEENFDLILAGAQSDDHCYGQTGIILAEILGLPHTSMAVRLEVREQHLRAIRELESGWSQPVEIPIPCVVSMQSTINKPRYASVKGILDAKRKEIRIQPRSEMAIPAGLKNQTIRKLVFPPRGRSTEFLEGLPREIAKRLADLLVMHGR